MCVLAKKPPNSESLTQNPSKRCTGFLFLAVSAFTRGKEMKAVASKRNHSFFFIPPTHALKRGGVWEEQKHFNPFTFPLLHFLNPKIKEFK